MNGERGSSSHLVFRVGTAHAALPLSLVREVAECPPVIAVPGSHEHVAGVALSRGLALPVYDLLRFAPLWRRGAGISRPAKGVVEQHLIVCGWGEVLLGVLGGQVDLLDGVGSDDGDPASGGGEMRADFLTGLVMRGGDAISLLDPARLFSSLGVPAERTRSAREAAGEEDPAGR
ncbi:MAG TPA: chemotaxis protein CheW [Candidatus Polarisedimenticolia bacterium]|nr:chemotaxis protein CheW [Candidatus Polarisedimenticolia bacterium]